MVVGIGGNIWEHVMSVWGTLSSRERGNIVDDEKQ